MPRPTSGRLGVTGSASPAIASPSPAGDAWGTASHGAPPRSGAVAAVFSSAPCVLDSSASQAPEAKDWGCFLPAGMHSSLVVVRPLHGTPLGSGMLGCPTNGEADHRPRQPIGRDGEADHSASGRTSVLTTGSRRLGAARPLLVCHRATSGMPPGLDPATRSAESLQPRRGHGSCAGRVGVGRPCRLRPLSAVHDWRSGFVNCEWSELAPPIGSSFPPQCTASWRP